MTTYNIDIQAKDGASSVLKSIQKNTDATTKSVGLLENAFKALAASATLKALSDASKVVDAISNKLAAISPATMRVSDSFRTMTAIANKFGESTSSLTDAFTLLGKAGIAPTEQRLSQVAAIAAATGQSMSELADAIEEGVGGSFGKLQKRIDGLDIKQYGNTWVATLNGMKIASSTNAKDIVDSVLRIGDSAEMQRALLEKNKGLTAALTRLNNDFSVSVKDSGISQAFGSVVDAINQAFIKSGLLTGALKGIAAVASFVAENLRPIAVALGLIVGASIISGLIAVAKGIQAIGIAAAFAKSKAGWISIFAGLLALAAEKSGALDKIFGETGQSADELNSEIEKLTQSVEKNNKGVDQADEALKQWMASISQAAGTTLSRFSSGMFALESAMKAFAKTGSGVDATNMLNWWEAINAEAEKLGIFFRTPGDITKITAFRELNKEIVGNTNSFDMLNEKLSILRNRFNELNASSVADMLANARQEAGQPFRVSVSGVANSEQLAMVKELGSQIDQLNIKTGRYTGTVLTLDERYGSLMMNAKAQAKVFDEQKAVAERLREEVKKGAMTWQEYNEAVKALGGDFLPEASTQMNVLKSDMEVVADTMRSQMFAATTDMARGIVNSITTGQSAFKGFKDFLGNLFNEIATQLVKKQLIDPIALAFNDLISNMLKQSAASGGGIGSFLTSAIGNFFGGFRAEGGPVSATQPYIVGEKGPELFMPSTAGNIIPNGQFGNGGNSAAPVNVNFNIQAIDTQTGVGFLLQNKPAIVSMITDAYNRRGRRGPLD